MSTWHFECIDQFREIKWGEARCFFDQNSTANCFCLQESSYSSADEFLSEILWEFLSENNIWQLNSCKRSSCLHPLYFKLMIQNTYAFILTGSPFYYLNLQYIWKGHLVLNLATAWNGLGAKINPKTGSAEGIWWLSDFVNVNFCSNLVKIMKSSALARVSPKQYLFPAKQ